MWRRALAFLIDLIPFAVLAEIENITGIAEYDIVGMFNFLFLFGYFTAMNYYYGGTLGKRMVGLRVALPASPNVIGQLIGRTFIKMICFFSPLSIVYGLIAIWRSDGRSLADFASGSTVVESASLAPPEQGSVFGRICASILIVFSPIIFMALIIFICFGGLLMNLLRDVLTAP
ncbi:MAG: hypothetical protein PF692_02085 [Kiritimatiellae bacterium]|jgi:uncharacterized RDD family membrane protein YckC|nr:hypothetical protein [Kiritimatiellia bacterium]